MLLQNFSVPRNADVTLTVDISSTVPSDTLIGSDVYWRVYGQSFAVPIESPILISKSTLSGDGSVTILESPPLTCTIQLRRGDTAGLDTGNYYHEATVVDEIGDHVPIFAGLMTVTLTENLV